MHHLRHLRPRELTERGADRPGARRRNQRQRKAIGRGIGKKRVESSRRLRVERFRKQIDLLIRRSRHHVDKLHRPEPERRLGAAMGLHLLAHRTRQRVENLQQHVELIVRLFTGQQVEPSRQLAEHVRIRARFTDHVNRGPHQL